MARFTDVEVIYLQLAAPPVPARPLPPGAEVHEVQDIDVATYRRLYNDVGRAWHWIDRNKVADEDLKLILSEPSVHVYVLLMDGETAGFCELDARSEPDVEIVYFGLMPQFIGRGIGGAFLDRSIEEAAALGERVWLHTCSLDHPAALPFYRKVGFVPFKTETRRQELRSDATDGDQHRR